LTQVVSKSHSGPIPSAEELGALETVLPGLADRVVSMAEREQSHRHVTTALMVEKEFSLRRNGQTLALIALFMLLATVFWLAWLGDSKAAAWLGAGTIVAVVSIFVTGRVTDVKDEGFNEQPQEKPASPRQNQNRLPKNRQPKKR
jgi:uncharacterized membrane protein